MRPGLASAARHGQASWYDRTPVEEHRSACLHCLELWTSLLEVVSWERATAPWSVEKIEPLLAAVPIKAQEKSKTSLLARMLGRWSCPAPFG